MTQSELSAALQRRQHTKKNLKRYMHTRSFNQLAGKRTAPGSERVDSHIFARVVLGIFTLGFLLTGLYFVLYRRIPPPPPYRARRYTIPYGICRSDCPFFFLERNFYDYCHPALDKAHFFCHNI